jgi:serine/threonine protein kinase
VQKLGKYEILAELGHGAMGVVYQARDPFLGRLVALKTINSNLVDRPDLLERFYQEAQSAGKLQHPNIVTIFELGQEKDTPFIAMEYLDGESLEKTIVRQSDLPLALKVGYIVRICQALEYAHKNRVVHRDIKPGNIMVNSEGVVKVVDFGIARLVDFSRTHTNMMIGTPAYMAPELFRKKKADERTDIWAVGVTFYELICYQRPFTGDGYDIIRAIAEDEFPSVSSIVPECGPEMEAIVQRMLRKQSVDRYQSMEDVLLDLEPVWNGMRSSAAAGLAERAREFYELGDLPKAQ